MRELIGYLYLKRKLHIASVIIIVLVFIGQMIIKWMMRFDDNDGQIIDRNQ